MKDKELLIRRNPETGLWEEYKEPYMTIECRTEEDYLQLEKILDYWKNRPQWHDAETDPPKEPMEYIVMIKGGANATTLLYDNGLWFEEDEEGWQTYYSVTHWMPLPEPPEEVNHDL